MQEALRSVITHEAFKTDDTGHESRFYRATIEHWHLDREQLGNVQDVLLEGAQGLRQLGRGAIKSRR